MDTEALLTVGGLLLAVITLLPAERRQNLWLRVRPLDIGVAVCAFLLIHYIKFFPVLESMGVHSLGPWRWGFDPDRASYLALLIAAIFIVVRGFTAKLTPRKIPAFRNLAESFLFAGRFPELLFLLEDNLSVLRGLIEKRQPSVRLRDRIRPPTIVNVFGSEINTDGRPRETNRLIKSIPRQWRSRIAQLLPGYDAPRGHAERLFERVFLWPPFLDYLATARPYFGLDVLLVNKPFFREPFLKMYVVALLNNQHSVLYDEMRVNQIAGDHGYVIDPLNQLISFFFGEPYRAEELKLYKAVGDAVSDRLKTLHRDPTTDPHRQALGDFHEIGRWRCSIFAGRCLFDYMITEALQRGVHWHMWLLYFESWTDRIVRNMADLGSDIDQSDEWPTPYHYLLYELVSTQCDWIRTSAEVDPGLRSVLIEKIDLEHGSIAKSATISLAACFRIVVESTHITPEFKGYLLGVIAHGYAHVVECGRDALARMIETALTAGGTRYRDLENFKIGLVETLSHVDDDSRYMAPAADLIKILSDLRVRRP